MQLSPHFQLEEFCHSEAAIRRGLDMTPPPAVVEALRALAVNVLEPLRAFLGKPIRVTSGYRPPEVNALVGGARDSQHVYGQAADIQVDGMTVREVCYAVIHSGVPFDQLIYEFGEWTHVSFRAGVDLRRETLTAMVLEGKPHYAFGLPT